MKCFIGFFTWILIASGWPIAAHRVEAAQVTKPQPADVRIDHDVLAKNERILGVFLDVLRGTGIHGGFVEVTACSELPKGHLTMKEGSTISEAMDALVAANPDYQWEMKDGTVNLIPRGGVPLLSTRVAKFQMNATDREMPAVLQDLLRLPEVRKREAALGLKQGPGQGGPGAMERHPVPKKPVPVHINLQNLSLLDAFNRVVQTSPKSVWIYYETDCNGAKMFTVEVASNY
jgi:hypothetical protein